MTEAERSVVRKIVLQVPAAWLSEASDSAEVRDIRLTARDIIELRLLSARDTQEEIKAAKVNAWAI